jgi:hypothetical protein
MMNRRLKKGVFGVAITTAALTAIIGLLHTSAARPLLMKIGGCPVGKASAAQIEQGRMAAARETRGIERAPARPALGFTLDAASPEDVHAWADRHGVKCAEKREGMLVVCHDVPLAALGREGEAGKVDDVSFAFRPRDRKLVNVTATSFALSSTAAATRMSHAVSRLGSEMGMPAKTAGEATPEGLARGNYSTATASYRYVDFMAEVSATSFGDNGVAVREHYMSAID